MKISVFGLGYVGAVSAACLARNGHTVVGVDTNPDKVAHSNAGNPPVVEPGLGDLLKTAVSAGTFRATSDTAEAILSTDISIVCVGTPKQKNGNLSLDAVRSVCQQIGAVLARKPAGHVVVIRSTMLPGTMRNVVIPALEEASGGKAGETFGLAHNPEFLRETTAIYDFDNPPKIVIGSIDRVAAQQTAALYRGIDAPLVQTTIETSEMVKYVDNIWHALKVGFANEIGNVCKASGIDSHEVMDIFCKDTKLNISSYYLRPGFAFGGSCLPKDTAALNYRAKELDLELPIIGNVLASNRIQLERAVENIMSRGKRRVAMLGLSFKAGTDDLRDSPLVHLVEQLIGRGQIVQVYDSSVNLALLTGANKESIRSAIPHIEQLMVGSLDEAIANADIIVVGHKSTEFNRVASLMRDDQMLIDLVRIDGVAHLGPRYDGINW